ncbi:MAG: ATP-binding protein [Boseongicola sp.]|nr:ATP-binding protein [Boseongicola sp.]
MRSSTGRWVSGEDFFDRQAELDTLESRVRGRNHVLVSGQRRMGKTSILRELGRRLEDDGWAFLFVDVEGAASPEDAVADIAQATHPYQPISSRFAAGMRRWFSDTFEEVGPSQFRLKVRAGLDAGSWRRYGERLLRDCANQDRPVLLVIDEVPIFLKRMLERDGSADRVDEFLSWLRATILALGEKSPVLILSGSIGLDPLVRRLGIPDRINHLDPFRLGPWNRETSVACFERLAESHELRVDGGVAGAVHDALGLGIPQHVQSFFARLRENATMQGRRQVTVEDVAEVYRNGLLGPSGQSDLVHYETRLKEAFDDEAHSLAMEIVAEAAIEGVFTPGAERSLAALYGELMEDVAVRIADVLEVLVHDGCLESGEHGYRFQSRLLKDWWAARFRDHHVALEGRLESFAADGNAK